MTLILKMRNIMTLMAVETPETNFQKEHVSDILDINQLSKKELKLNEMFN